jgi:hypothetical protein
MKTNLQKILSISGQSGLFLFINQANSGVIVESLITKKRTLFGMQSRLTSLSDISIFTTQEELPLKSVLEKMRDHLSSGQAPDSKSNPDTLKKFFETVVPEYDKDRFYTSHMKKVVEWYNILRENASLDFEEKEAANETPQE